MEKIVKVLGMSVIPLVLINWGVYFWVSNRSNKRISAWGDFSSFEGGILRIITSITVACVLLVFLIAAIIAWNNYISRFTPQA